MTDKSVEESVIKIAENVIRQVIVPNYPVDKRIDEMTSYEVGQFGVWRMPIADALQHERSKRREAEEALEESINTLKTTEARVKELEKHHPLYATVENLKYKGKTLAEWETELSEATKEIASLKQTLTDEFDWKETEEKIHEDYRKGQEDMKKKAVEVAKNVKIMDRNIMEESSVWRRLIDFIAKAISEIPIGGEDELRK